MSYARLGPNSDVYVVDGGKGLFCWRCQLEGDGKPFDHRGMVIHLKEHRLAGHKVPAEAFDRLADEIAHGCDNILTREHTIEEMSDKRWFRGWPGYASVPGATKNGFTVFDSGSTGFATGEDTPPAQQHVDNTPSCSVCGYAPQVRGCVAGKCGRKEP